MKRSAQFQDLGVDELRQRAQELDDELFRLRIQKATGQLEKAPKIREVRRDVARIKTFLRQKAGRDGVTA
ncbi:MAG: 50S ribosomal protein L29 [Luteitalea sp.]|nr:50S ribosomal protein L29 [Luteitalea sp.]